MEETLRRAEQKHEAAMADLARRRDEEADEAADVFSPVTPRPSEYPEFAALADSEVGREQLQKVLQYKMNVAQELTAALQEAESQRQRAELRGLGLKKQLEEASEVLRDCFVSAMEGETSVQLKSRGAPSRCIMAG